MIKIAIVVSTKHLSPPLHHKYIQVCLAALASAEAEADAWYGPYSNWNMYGNNWNMNGNNWNMMNGNNWNMYWNRPGMQEGYRFNYGKRSADAEPEAEPDAEAFYGPYSYSSFGYNWPMNNNMNYNMNYMTRPYHQFSNYRYHF